MDRADKLEITNIFRKEIEPLTQEIKTQGESVRKMNQTLYGVQGMNGLVGDVKEAQKSISALKRFRTQVITIGGTIQALLAWMGIAKG